MVVDVRWLRQRGVGMSLVIAEMLKELAQPDWTLVLITDDREDARRLRVDHTGAEIVYLRKSTGFWWEQVQLAQWLFKHHPEIFISPANFGLPLIRPRRTRCILVVHDIIPLIYPKTYIFRRPARALRYLLSITISVLVADQIVSDSEQTSKDILRVYRRESKVIYPPLPSLADSTPKPALSDGHYMVYVGEFDPRKNVPQLLKAFREFRRTAEGSGVALVILGRRGDLAHAMLHEHGLGDASLVTGYVSDDEKWSYFAHAAACSTPLAMRDSV